MLILLIVIWLLTIAYGVLMLIYARGWHSQDVFKLPRYTPGTKITVIIPARNEAGNISRCIRSILANDYPKELFEIVVIDDHSTDETYDEVVSFAQSNVRCIRLADVLEPGEQLNSYKKKAIETGISQSSGSVVITTDADCIVPPRWLRQFAYQFELKQSVMVVAPVAFTTDGTVVQSFQVIDFMSMQGITVAAHRLKLGNMSNGANLAFSKEAFYDVGGYKGVDHLASGDDYLLTMKMHQAYPDRIHYLKSRDAIVQTAPQPTWNSFIQQRIRWASKSGKYDDKKLTGILMMVYLFNLSFLLLFILGFTDNLFWLLGASILLLKTGVELYFLLPVASFFRRQKALVWFPFLQPLHIIYIISAGFMGMIGKYQWKGRNVK